MSLTRLSIDLYIKVCLTGLYFGDSQVFVGKNGTQAEFWIDGDENGCNANELMSTQSLVVKNKTVADSFCSGTGQLFKI